ncbi:AAA+ family ATPase [Palleronia sp. KMU-117]|uniref:AAA+ family ATPase n=1 Tax=Palleronia sp. KMU-117 TaxID=3434108 RepID=UPI003D72F33C
MRQLVMMTALWLAAVPAAAQDSDIDEGRDLLSEGTRLLLRGLLAEMEPALRGLQGALRDLDAYHAPEILPNGDIIIRRKTPEERAVPAPDPTPDGADGIEL